MERDSRAIPWMLDTDDEHYASDAIHNASYAHSLLPQLVSHLPTLISRGRVSAKTRGAPSSCPPPARSLVSGTRGERVNLEIQPPPN